MTRCLFKLTSRVKACFEQKGAPPDTTTDFYKIGKVMGKGAFGKVNLAIHRLSGKFVALKSINKQFMADEVSKQKVMQEFNILTRTKHPNVVRLYESFETAQHIVFVMELCGGGDLLTYVRKRRRIKEEVAAQLFSQIVQAVMFCHSKSILHRDIKLDNILLTSQGTVKLCDFGVSKLITRPREKMFEQCGTPAYIAPEVFENKGYCGYQSDVWSAGVVLYAMLYGTVPFKAANMTELQKQVCKAEPDYKDDTDAASPLAVSLLKLVLEKDPLKRLTPRQILQHPWMQQVKVSVFSDPEKSAIKIEFLTYTQSKERALHLEDPFAEQLLVSTQNSQLRNISSRSVILAPFNSSHSDLLALQNSAAQMMEPQRIIKFNAKLAEVNRQYERNNNAQLDNGVYHKQETNRLATSLNQDQLQSKLGELTSRDSIASEEPVPNSEWKQLQNLLTDEEVKVEFVDNEGLNMFDFDYVTIDAIKKCGFREAYIMDTLRHDQLNHVSAFYHLLTQKCDF